MSSVVTRTLLLATLDTFNSNDVVVGEVSVGIAGGVLAHVDLGQVGVDFWLALGCQLLITRAEASLLGSSLSLDALRIVKAEEDAVICNNSATRETLVKEILPACCVCAVHCCDVWSRELLDVSSDALCVGDAVLVVGSALHSVVACSYVCVVGFVGNAISYSWIKNCGLTIFPVQDCLEWIAKAAVFAEGREFVLAADESVDGDALFDGVLCAVKVKIVAFLDKCKVSVDVCLGAACKLLVGKR